MRPKPIETLIGILLFVASLETIIVFIMFLFDGVVALTGIGSVVLLCLLAGCLVTVWLLKLGTRWTYLGVAVIVCPSLLFPVIGFFLLPAMWVCLYDDHAIEYLAGRWTPPPEAVVPSATGRRRAVMAPLLAAVLAIVGGIAAFYATFFVCAVLGPSIAQVGWVFCFVTIPIGAAVGGGIGIAIVDSLPKGADGSHEEVEKRSR